MSQMFAEWTAYVGGRMHIAERRRRRRLQVKPSHIHSANCIPCTFAEAMTQISIMKCIYLEVVSNFPNLYGLFLKYLGYLRIVLRGQNQNV